jgi:hypothetical protein
MASPDAHSQEEGFCQEKTIPEIPRDSSTRPGTRRAIHESFSWSHFQENVAIRRRLEWTDERQGLIADPLPTTGMPGGPCNSRRTTLEGSLWVLRTGAVRRELSDRYGKRDADRTKHTGQKLISYGAM